MFIGLKTLYNISYRNIGKMSEIPIAIPVVKLRSSEVHI